MQIVTMHTPTLHATTRRSLRARQAAAAVTLLAAGLLAGCGSSEDDATDATTSGDASDESSTDESSTAPLTLTDGWAISGEEGMSSAFGTLENTTGEDVVVVAATSDASPEVELHETVADESGEMVMREVDGGFVVPAGGELVLEPGGNHLMLMDLDRPLLAGDLLEVSLTLEDGSSADLTFDVRDFTGGHEHYEDAEAQEDHETSTE